MGNLSINGDCRLMWISGSMSEETQPSTRDRNKFFGISANDA